MLDPLECYELCVQSPRHIVTFLRAVHANEPRLLREDFCGSAAVSRRWLEEARKRGEGAKAIALDLESGPLARATDQATEAGITEGLELRHADAVAAADTDGADVVFVGNFSIGYIHERQPLVEYLKRSRERLARGNGGFGGSVFVCDTYGGAAAFKLGGFERKHPGRRGEVIRYSWLHEMADPLTGLVENSISFRVEVSGEVVQEWPRAFVYRWRLWSIAELREAMKEAGFRETEVYKDVNLAPGQEARRVEDASGLGEDWIVLVVGRT
jgi:hypothetical protein